MPNQRDFELEKKTFQGVNFKAIILQGLYSYLFKVKYNIIQQVAHRTVNTVNL